MKPIRHLAAVVWLALALLVGQQAAALHDLGHATEKLSQKHDSKPASSTCDQCFAFAELSVAMGATPPSMPAVDATPTQFVHSPEQGIAGSPRLAFRSRAPPTLL
jgi:hypothetical protein